MPPPASYFNPRAPYGARPALFPILARSLLFQSTCPVRGTTRLRVDNGLEHLDFNPRAPYRARRRAVSPVPPPGDFNPRAPYRARPFPLLRQPRRLAISIHVPRTGHDWAATAAQNGSWRFQSTCPVQGTTAAQAGVVKALVFQSTCPVQGTTRCASSMRCST